MKENFIIFLLSMFSLSSFSQEIGKELLSSPVLLERDSNKLSIRLDATAFFKNNEYFNPIAKGETFPGMRIIPTVRYQLHDKFLFEVGTNTLFYSGNDDVSVKLHTRLQYSPIPEFSFVMGNYYGGVNHRLIEPLYQRENHLVEAPESGVQLIYNNGKYFADIWLDWERFIHPGDDFQEALTFGISTSACLTSKESRLKVSIPLQLLIHHEGGQIDTSEEEMIIVGNLAAGVNLEYEISRDRFIKSMGLSAYWLGYYDKKPNAAIRPYEKGWAVYPILHINASPFEFQAGYWHADKFFAYGGEPLFASFSLLYPDSQLPERNLITAKLSYSKKLLRTLRIGIYAETYTDMDRNKTDYSFGVNLRFTPRLFNWLISGNH